MESTTVQSLVTVGAEACGSNDMVSQETLMGPELFKRIRFHWDLLIKTLGELNGVASTLPPSVTELLSQIAAIVNDAAIGPGYADICFALRSPDLGRLGKELWKEAIRHHRGPAVAWPTTVSPQQIAEISEPPRRIEGEARAATVNDRMKAEMAADLEKVKGFTAQQWADHLGCVKSTIAGTATWKSLSLLRQQSKAELRADRLRREKSVRPNERGH